MFRSKNLLQIRHQPDWEDTLIVLGRMGLSAILFWAGFVKLSEPLIFIEAVVNYEMVPQAALMPVAYLIPRVEICLAFCLLKRSWMYRVGLAVSVLSVIFLGAIGWALGRGLDIPCGCFGAASDPVTWVHFVRAFLLLLAGLLLAWYSHAASDRRGTYESPFVL